MKTISVQELCALLATTAPESVQLLDVREPEELNIVNLKDFVSFPLGSYAEWQNRILTELDPAKPTYVLCHHGLRSAQMAQWLAQKGFSQVYNISGGIDAWACEVDPHLPRY